MKLFLWTMAALSLLFPPESRAEVKVPEQLFPPESRAEVKVPEQLFPPESRAEVKASGQPVIAFRTNLLLSLLNIGAEYPINVRWSVAADFYCPWCQREWMNRWTAPQMNCLQGLGGYLEGRYWFGAGRRLSGQGCGRPILTGHSLGLVAGAAYYDLERKGRGQQGEVFAIGTGYAYAVPIGRKGRAHLELDIAAGAVYRVWHPYEVHEEGGYLLREEDGEGVGIGSESERSLSLIRTGVSIVFPIFSGRSAGRR